MSSKSFINGPHLIVAACVITLYAGGPEAVSSQQIQQSTKPSNANTTQLQGEEQVQDDAERRRMWNTFREQRPSGERQGRLKPTVPNRPSTARRTNRSHPPAKANSKPNPAVSDDGGFVGLTLWQLQSSTGSDIKERRSIRQRKKTAQAVSWTPIRLRTDSLLTDGQLTRLSVETTRSGYLYVINREEYNNGKLGEPLLIFPTNGTRGGDNQVSAGDFIEIPDQKDEVPYFTVSRSRPDQKGEILIVIVTPTPLINPARIGDEPLTLSAEQVDLWEKQWGVGVKRIDTVEAAGTKYTKEENEASMNKNRKLTSIDPIPQTLYYIAPKAGDPMLVKVRLRYADSNALK